MEKIDVLGTNIEEELKKKCSDDDYEEEEVSKEVIEGMNYLNGHKDQMQKVAKILDTELMPAFRKAGIEPFVGIMAVSANMIINAMGIGMKLTDYLVMSSMVAERVSNGHECTNCGNCKEKK